MSKGFDELTKFHSLSLMKWDEDNYASENTQLAKDFYEAGQQARQAEVDELNFQLAEMKSRLNEAYTDGQSSMYKTKQTEVNELQSEVKGYKSIYGKLELERDELQKRIDDARKLINLFFDGESLDRVVSANYILKGNQND